MNRRSFLLATSAAALAGCAGQSANAGYAAAAVDIGTISAALVPFGALVSTIPDAGPLAEAALTAAAVIAKLASQMASATSPTSASQFVVQVQAAVNTVVAAAAEVPGIPANVDQAIKDMQTLVESVAVAASGVAGASPAADAARMRLKAFAAGGKH